MPPTTDTDRGWKAFFALLMVLQVIALGVMWRTYDAVSSVSKKSDLSEYKIDHVISPLLKNHDDRLYRLERAGP
jgi:hypothetical protein